MGTKSSKTGRNGKIEIMRFVFCMVVIFFHCYNRLGIKEPLFEAGGLPVWFFARGYIGVEFFFVVSGYLMAKSAYSSNLRIGCSGGTADIGRDTAAYIWKKFRGIFPYHLVAFVLIFVELAVQQGIRGVDFVEYCLDVLPGFLLIQKYGFNFRNINSVEWYISAMLIAMFLLYPICRKYYSMFVHVIAPLGGMLLSGYLIYNFGTFTGASRWIGLGFGCVVRAIAEIGFGASAFEAARVLGEKKLSVSSRSLLTLAEAVGYLSVIGFAVLRLPSKYEIFALLAVTVSVMLSFSGQTYGKTIFNRPYAYWLGAWSLPLYLTQLFAFYLVKERFTAFPIKTQVLAVMGITAVMSVICKVLGDLFNRMTKKKKGTVKKAPSDKIERFQV